MEHCELGQIDMQIQEAVLKDLKHGNRLEDKEIAKLCRSTMHRLNDHVFFDGASVYILCPRYNAETGEILQCRPADRNCIAYQPVYQHWKSKKNDAKVFLL